MGVKLKSVMLEISLNSPKCLCSIPIFAVTGRHFVKVFSAQIKKRLNYFQKINCILD